MMTLAEKPRSSAHASSNSLRRQSLEGSSANSAQTVGTKQGRASCACGGGCPRCQNHDASFNHERSAAVEKTLAEPGHSLEANLRSNMEDGFGHRFDKVRLHTDPAAAGTARALNAHAYAVGQHLVFDAGEYRPHTARGLHLLAHELAHVVQQGQTPYHAESPIQLSPILRRSWWPRKITPNMS